MAEHKSTSLNLWDVETKGSKLDIDCHQFEVDFLTTGGQPIKVHPNLHLVDGVNGDIKNVSQKIYDLDAAIASGAAGSSAATSLVQQNLDAYSSSTNATIGTIQADLANEIAQRVAGQSTDATNRASMQADLETKITAEETARKDADAVLSTTLQTEITNRTDAVAAEATARVDGDTALSDEIKVERGRVDAILAGADVKLDSFMEVVNSYQTLNTDALAQIADLTARIQQLEDDFDGLTSSS